MLKNVWQKFEGQKLRVQDIVYLNGKVHYVDSTCRDDNPDRLNCVTTGDTVTFEDKDINLRRFHQGTSGFISPLGYIYLIQDVEPVESVGRITHIMRLETPLTTI